LLKVVAAAVFSVTENMALFLPLNKKLEPSVRQMITFKFKNVKILRRIRKNIINHVHATKF
jgi:hypothetical protein